MFFILITGFGFFLCLLWLAKPLRLGLPLLYAMIVPTVFHSWFYAHYVLAYGIWYAMLGLVVISWFITILHRVRG